MQDAAKVAVRAGLPDLQRHDDLPTRWPTTKSRGRSRKDTPAVPLSSWEAPRMKAARPPRAQPAGVGTTNPHIRRKLCPVDISTHTCVVCTMEHEQRKVRAREGLVGSDGNQKAKYLASLFKEGCKHNNNGVLPQANLVVSACGSQVKIISAACQPHGQEKKKSDIRGGERVARPY